ncbi:fukutin-related protein isoform X1 [Neodiprion virginianus]|uniref:Fukutin-related protein isoform X1 n=1 Tax=Neodiprion lecontei TaxID=441921 RepID=A0A6J0C593_NEOLC|nr:fukutin-related protein isoform X1 [Neodiprion lecontei]XP_046621600.1 fukutin-related protein isoform X1 [Neodiprion virginianus]
MRLKLVKILLVLALVGNIVVWHRIWRLFAAPSVSLTATPAASTVETSQKVHRGLARSVTIVIRQFETFENDVSATVESVMTAFPLIPILIICDQLPYPPLELDFKNNTMRYVKLINLQLNFNKSFDERNPLFFIRTKFVLFLPDATRLSTKQVLQSMIIQASKLGAVSVPVGANPLSCIGMALRVKEWSLEMSNIDGSTCDSIIGRHGTMIEARTLRKLSDPFILPFTDAFYIQTTALGAKVHIMNDHHFNEGKPLFRSHQAQWKVEQLSRSREREMFEKLGIKKVTRVSGSVEWYGCSRETPRCFGSVVNGIPSYLYQNRYTPPCCLTGLRRVAHHVFDKLEEVGIRFWIEGDSLLGAMRNGDILPWGHQVDVGLNRDDIMRSPWLARARNKPVTDNQGFIWEKATEGEFFKVQYSKTNHLHVNLLPFYSENGTMMKDAWFLKNKDFPEQFLHPMSSIEFAGRQVPCPNNIRDFLEIKYYKGVIENPEVPGKLFPD